MQEMTKMITPGLHQ